MTIHQVGDDGGAPYIAMPLLRGQTLAERLEELEKGKGSTAADKSLPTAEVLRIGREIAAGLEAARECGLIHRDVKPANIWLEAKTGRVKLLDFGLARASAAEQQLTQSGMVLGTPSYMAPEQARGQPVDHRSDLFSLGCVLYCMAAGKRPFSGPDALSTLMAVSMEHPAAPASLNPGVPAALDELILRLLAKAPADRPQTAAEVLERIAEIESSLVEAPAGTQRKRDIAAPQRLARRPWLAALVGVAALLFLLACATLFYGWRDGALAPEFDLAGNTATRGQMQKSRKTAEPGKDAASKIARGAETPGATAATSLADAGKPLEVDWSPGPAEGALPGLVPRPAKLPGSGRWQVATRLPLGLDIGASNALAFSPDGRWLGAVSSDGHLRLYDAATQKLDRILLGHEGSAYAIAWSPEPDVVATGGLVDCQIRLWSVRERKTTAVLPGHTTGVMCLVWSRDGRLASAGQWGDRSVRIWDRAGEQQAVVRFSENVQSVAWSPDGSKLAVASGRRSIWLISPQGERERELQASGSVNSIAFSGDGRWLASCGGDGTVCLWDTKDWRPLRTLRPPAGGSAHRLAFSHDSRLLAQATYNGSVNVFDLSADAWLSSKELRCNVIAWSIDDGLLAGSLGNGGVHFCRRDLTAAAPGVAAFYTDYPAISSDARRCALSLGPNKDLRLFELDNGSSRIIRRAEAYRVDWKADGASIAAVLQHPAGYHSIWDTTSGASQGAWKASVEASHNRFSPDGTRLAAGGADGVVRIWSVDQRLLAESETLSGKVTALAWTRDGNQLAAALDGAPGTVQVFDVLDASTLTPTCRWNAPFAGRRTWNGMTRESDCSRQGAAEIPPCACSTWMARDCKYSGGIRSKA